MRKRLWLLGMVGLVVVGLLVACGSNYDPSQDGLVVIGSQGAGLLETFSFTLSNGHISSIANSPYNTYKFPGLPPGPICNPSLSSIMAALYPAQTSYMYFLSDPTTGGMYFATTYEDHLANKEKYIH